MSRVQATVGLVVSVVIGVVAGAVLGGIWGAWIGGHAPEIQEAINKMPLPFGSDDPESNAAAAAWLQEKGLSQEEAEQAVRAYHNDVTAQGVDDIRAIMPANVTDDELAKFVGGFNRAAAYGAACRSLVGCRKGASLWESSGR
jgi:hypothetical protein